MPDFVDRREMDAANGLALADKNFCNRLCICYHQPVLREQDTINSWAEWHQEQKQLQNEGSWRDHNCLAGINARRAAGPSTPLAPSSGRDSGSLLYSTNNNLNTGWGEANGKQPKHKTPAASLEDTVDTVDEPRQFTADKVGGDHSTA